MSEKKLVRPVALAVGAALAGSFALAGTANAETGASPFAVTALSAGYMLGPGGDQDKHAEGACGGDKGDKNAEGKCGGAKGDKGAEGSCGGDKKKDAEGKCGEGKCGEGKCGGSKE